MDNLKIYFLYRISAWSLIVAVCTGVILNVIILRSGAEAVNSLPGVLRFPIGVIGAMGALGFFALWTGMIWHSAAVSDRSITKRVLWLFLIVFTGPLGALLYYFLAFQTAGEPAPI